MANETCKKIIVATEAKVVIEPGPNVIWVTKPWSFEKYAEKLERWAKDVHEFFRDHRHQDVNNVFVEVTKQDQCSACGKEWETMDDEGVECCAWCGVPVEKQSEPVK